MPHLGYLKLANIAFALWVCWMNEETKEVFDEGGLLD